VNKPILHTGAFRPTYFIRIIL